ncbi:hypothetical protein AB1Y20_008961 [Prymnesium parvum]|uniref:ODAD1 central coiled coil region domain-containing protein n=1 Tax=Prymnesium parvum TaxID=97485 RepID=A0AB34K008_PRYPA
MSSPRLPHLVPTDPAARSPRRGYIPGAEDNPYIPHMRSRVAKPPLPRSARGLAASAPPSASPSRTSLSPRAPSASRHAAPRADRYKRAERLQDSYQTALSRETLLSEQYDKELSQVKESLAKLQMKQPADKVHDMEVGALRTRGKLEKRCAFFECKLNELEKYNQKLMDLINGLRKQNDPHRQAEARMAEQSKKLAADMAQQKQLCHKALDERERCRDQLRHIREDSEQDKVHFMETLEHLKRESDALDRQNRAAMQTLEKATEEAKRQQWCSMRSHRAHKERLEVRYGYLRSQLEGVDRDFRELQRIVGVHFVPSQPESLQQIISKYVEKEGKIASLLKYSEQQNDEIHDLQVQIAEGEAVLERVGGGDGGHASALKSSDAPDESAKLEEAYAHSQRSFDSVCELLEGMFGAAKCEGTHDLMTKRCSTSTVGEFMSAIASRLDELQLVAASLRDSSLGRGDKRKAHAVFDGFLQPSLGAAAKAEEQAVEMVKRMLPSMSDQGPDQEGENDQQERARAHDARKGNIDRHKRDESIAAWLERQQQLRGAVTARPTIREYYDLETKSFFENKKMLYPPASARL